MSVLITTEILGEHPVLTSVNTKLDLVNAWVRSGDGLVGFGEYKKFEVKVKIDLKKLKPGGKKGFQSLKFKIMFMVVEQVQFYSHHFHLILMRYQYLLFQRF